MIRRIYKQENLGARGKGPGGVLLHPWLPMGNHGKVRHRRYVFAIPQSFRQHFRLDRKPLGLLSFSAWESVREMMAVVCQEPSAVSGRIVSIQTYVR
jgi:hypothetical protein